MGLQEGIGPSNNLCRVVSTVAMLLGLGLAACGESRESRMPSGQAHSGARVAKGATLPQPETKPDGEMDSDSYPGEPDNDNNHVFGHPASTAERRAATALVKRYYAATAARDGALACSLMYSSFAEAVSEDYGPPSATSSSSTRICATTVTALFARSHEQLRHQAATLTVAAVRVRRRVASVRIGFGGRPKFYMLLHLERGTWKIDRLLAGEDAIYVE